MNAKWKIRNHFFWISLCVMQLLYFLIEGVDLSLTFRIFFRKINLLQWRLWNLFLLLNFFKWIVFIVVYELFNFWIDSFTKFRAGHFAINFSKKWKVKRSKRLTFFIKNTIFYLDFYRVFCLFFNHVLIIWLI